MLARPPGGDDGWHPPARRESGQGVGIPGGVAFNTMRDGNAEIYVMDADGRSPTRLTNHAGIDQFPDWSPNGSEIVFRRDIDLYVPRRER